MIRVDHSTFRTGQARRILWYLCAGVEEWGAFPHVVDLPVADRTGHSFAVAMKIQADFLVSHPKAKLIESSE